MLDFRLRKAYNTYEFVSKQEEFMSIIFEKPLPSPEEIAAMYPLSADLKALKARRDQEIKDVLSGKDNRFLVIIGPCSADNEVSVCDYMERIAKVNDKVKDKLLIVPRVYTNKPRTTGEGYKGILHQPDPEKAENMEAGLKAIRQLHIKAIEASGLTCADEMLYPDNYQYLEDILSYVAVGARSVENQQHRLVASGMNVPVGMKNPTSGDYSVMINAVYAGQKSHCFIYHGSEVRSDGNPYTHIILRGAVNKHGNTIPNYHYEDLKLVSELYAEKNLLNPACIVDANHSNSGKKFKEQIRIVKEILHSRSHSEEINNLVKGVMIESYIEEGCQKIGEHIYGKSITDPCLGWNDTEKLLYDIAERV